MPRTPAPHLWSSYTWLGTFQLLNPDHPEIAARVLGDLDAGIAVYYDSRWDLTTQFCRFLLTHPTWIAGRSVLVLGAGIGLETLVIGRLCKTLYLNDRARPRPLCAAAAERHHRFHVPVRILRDPGLTTG